MDKNVTIIAVVAVVIVVAAAAFIVLNGDKGSSHDDFDTTSRLLVYGNANNDNYLDDKDVSLIQDMIDGKFTYDIKDYPYADANHDGKVNSADVDLVKKFIKGEKATMYYVNWNLGVSSIQYPLSGKIAGTYDSTLWIAQIVGVYDDMSYLCRVQSYIDGLDEKMFPGASEKLIAQGSNGNFDPDLLIKNDIKVVLGDPYGISAEYLEKMSKYIGSDIQTILIPENREINGLNWSNSVVTLGVMYNHQSYTKEYVKFIENFEKDFTEKAKKIKDKAEDKTYLLVYTEPGGTSGTDKGLDVRSTGATQYGDVVNVENLPLTCAYGKSSSNWVDTNVDNILAMDPDVIIFSTWGPFQKGYTQEQYIDLVKEQLEYFKTSRAYAEGNIYAISFEVYGTLPGIAGLAYLGAQIWPEYFSESEGIDYLQEYFDKFTSISGTDVTTVPTLLPLTLEDME